MVARVSRKKDYPNNASKLSVPEGHAFCPRCNGEGTDGKKHTFGYGWQYQECALCKGKGFVSEEIRKEILGENNA